MNVKVLISGVVLEGVYLLSMMVPNINMEVSSIVSDLSKHALFQLVVLTIILVGAFKNGNAKDKYTK